MADRDFQTRLVGIVIGAIATWLLAMAVVAIWDAFSKATDSGPMYAPSEWRAK